MNSRICPLLLALVIVLLLGGATIARAETGSEIVREMNLARENPTQYARHLEDLRVSYRGTLLVLPGRIPMRTKEGSRALDEAIRFLRKTSPRPPLTFSPGISHAAADHCAEQAGGGMNHSGRGGSSPGDRLNRYGTWGGTWGENLACGRSGAREIVIALIIDDGLGSRKHRKNIFNPSYNFAGAAVGPHATYRTICSIDFAGDYLEAGQSPNDRLVARNP